MKIFKGWFIAFGRLEDTRTLKLPKTPTPSVPDRMGRYGNHSQPRMSVPPQASPHPPVRTKQ